MARLCCILKHENYTKEKYAERLKYIHFIMYINVAYGLKSDITWNV